MCVGFFWGGVWGYTVLGLGFRAFRDSEFGVRWFWVRRCLCISTTVPSKVTLYYHLNFGTGCLHRKPYTANATSMQVFRWGLAKGTRLALKVHS